MKTENIKFHNIEFFLKQISKKNKKIKIIEYYLQFYTHKIFTVLKKLAFDKKLRKKQLTFKN